MRVRPVTIKNALVWERGDIQRRDLYFAERILAAPALDALEIDFEGYTIFPGLINAHDHLELNHYPRTKFREVYNNAHEWGEDVNARLNEPPFKQLRAYPLEDRLFIGGLKNLLCGATTVAQHGPPHKYLFRPDFPVRVLEKYGWAHSLHFNTDEEVVRSYRATPKHWPWFIHLAEGTDEIAAGEYQRLKALGCLGLNTIPVHGVGLTKYDVIDSGAIAGKYFTHHGSQLPIVICPTTNVYLLSRSGHPGMGFHTMPLLGSDSRLTAEGDLLHELQFVSTHYENAKSTILSATTTHFRWQWQLKDAVIKMRPDHCSDFLLISTSDDPETKLCTSRRKDIALVIRDGIPQIGDPELMAKFPHIQTVEAVLDGVPKAINLQLARRIARCTIPEPGLELGLIPKRRFFVL
ncbi:MAG: hypothetical protein SF029_18940 [bacterium]|nr:hypothetical protein [bacterium]